MPVTGEIAELPLPELLNMMRHRAGKLTLLATGQIAEMVLHFSPGYLCGLQVGNRTLKSEVQVVDKLVAVTASPMGRFIFEPQKHASSLLGSVRMGVDRLALILVSRVDEISVNKAQLPPAHCVFRLHLEAGKPEFEDVELAEFFRTAESLLYCGISAEKLATIEQTAVEQVQLYFYKLQLLNLIARARRDDQWARLDNVLETKSTPLRVTAARSPSEKITPRIHADPTRPSPPPWAAEERIVGFGGMEQRKVTRLTGPPTDDDDELT
ncbi:MAG: DUF4388 domain-containing protein, partial [Verrucomicrobia bacterium]|nr:DUF4388 domain-containing protein [Verrucomicrobiota bacterium]